MTTPATLERQRFADELLVVGPDVDTLCEGWTARDLAAHVVLRDRRPDAMPGVLVSMFSGYTDKVQSKIADTDWDELVELVRVAPKWSPTQIDAVDRLMNTTEFASYIAWRREYEKSPQFKRDKGKQATTGRWSNHVQLVPHGRKNKCSSVSFADVALTMSEAKLRMSLLYGEELSE